jgi:hypothetical protein
VRILCSIIQTSMATMLNARYDLLLGCLVAAKFVGDQHAGHILAPVEQFAKERLGGRLVSPALDQHIQHRAMLINGPPQIRRFAVDV